MDDASRKDALESLLIEIDYAWRDPESRPRIAVLIQEHPDLAEEARDFLAALEAMDEPVDDELQAANNDIHLWLLSTGIDTAIATAARTTHSTSTRTSEASQSSGPNTEPQAAPDASESWLGFLGNRTGRRKAELARSLPHVTLELLSLVSRFPTIVPVAARRTLSDLAQEHLGIPANESLRYLQDRDVISARAASRQTERERAPENFAEILERAALSTEDRCYWEEHARGG